MTDTIGQRGAIHQPTYDWDVPAAGHAEPPGTPLFPRGEDRRFIEDALTQALARSQDRIQSGCVTPTIDLRAFQDQLACFDFEHPQQLCSLLQWTIAQLEQGVVHLNHPRYFGLFNPYPTFPAQCADRIAATFNPQLATWTTSPVAVELESHVIRAVARRLCYPADAAGHFTSGGAEANYTALLLALSRLNPSFAAEGSRAYQGAPVFYVSREGHLAWIKIAHQAGIGRSAVRLVATDGMGRLDPGSLEKSIENDRRDGFVPVMIGATAGTTNAGMIDPLKECNAIADAAGMWMHVDAAWGGAAIASNTYSRLLEGISKADSVTIDAHKWFSVTMGCGMFITRHPAELSSTFQVTATYMPSNTAGIDPYLTSVQWSRRFLGLRLFLSLAVAGWTGYADHVERCIELAAELADRLRAVGWSVVNDPSLAVLCIRPPSHTGHVRSIVDRVISTGNVWISMAHFEGQDVIRACVTNGLTQRPDLDVLVSELQQAAAATGCCC